MAEHRLPAESPKPRHETTDANPRNIVIFAVALFLTIVVAVWGMKVFFNDLTGRQGLGPPVTPFEQGRPLPPEGLPRLQVTPAEDVEHYRESQTKILDSYGWVDRPAGVVRIPIRRAMELLLQKGLPVRTGKPVEGIVEPMQEDHLVPKGYMPQD